MGIRVPLIIPPIGNLCWCHPSILGTPSVIFVTFWGLMKCPGHPQPPNGVTFACNQLDGLPCTWQNEDDGTIWKVRVNYFCVGFMTQILLTDWDNNQYFLAVESWFTPEHWPFANLKIACGGGNLAYGGFAMMFWMEAAAEIITAMNYPNDGNLFMEFFVKDDVYPVYKFCHVNQHLNQTILYIP